jgi:hypothetical protein
VHDSIGKRPRTPFEFEVQLEQEMAGRPSPSLAPEHDWAAASLIIHPALRPAGTLGVDGLARFAPPTRGGPGKPLIASGPAGLSVVYVIPANGFDILVGMEHLLAWGVGPAQVDAAAMANLSAWSASSGWAEEVEGRRKIVWSDLGGGMDAARILLADVRERLAVGLAPARRVIVGLPERDLLIAASLAEGDDEFAALFGCYVADRMNAADDPVDERVFELVDGELVILTVAGL